MLMEINGFDDINFEKNLAYLGRGVLLFEGSFILAASDTKYILNSLALISLFIDLLIINSKVSFHS